MRPAPLLLCVLISACAHRGVYVTSDPSGALVRVDEHSGLKTVTPGRIPGLRVSREYTLTAEAGGCDTAHANVDDTVLSYFPMIWPANIILGWSRAYDTEVHFELNCKQRLSSPASVEQSAE